MWLKGRQESGYFKCCLMSYFGIDVYILKFPVGSSVPSHTDPLEGGLNHYRLNIILKQAKQGGVFYLDGKPGNRWLNKFRPDLSKHKVSKVIKGTRYVLSIGWVK